MDEWERRGGEKKSLIQPLLRDELQYGVVAKSSGKGKRKRKKKKGGRKYQLQKTARIHEDSYRRRGRANRMGGRKKRREEGDDNEETRPAAFLPCSLTSPIFVLKTG